ncbi:MAG: phosphatase PAP2 family protein [bacterium]
MPIFTFDKIIFNLINGLAGNWPVLDYLGIFFAEYLPYVLTAVLIVWLIIDWKKRLKPLIIFYSTVIFSRLIVTEIIRYLLPRNRPFVDYDVNLLINHSASSSFPSGHASFYFALAMAIYLYNKKAGAVFLLMVSLMSIARVYVGVHWPTDIIAGAVVGIASAYVINFLKQKFTKRPGGVDN